MNSTGKRDRPTVTLEDPFVVVHSDGTFDRTKQYNSENEAIYDLAPIFRKGATVVPLSKLPAEDSSNRVSN